MKKHGTLVLFFFIAGCFFLHRTALFSQCTSPPDCIQNQGFVINTGGGNVNTGNLPDWYVSHGTPSLFNGFGSQDTFSVWMWSYSGNGEGIYGCFNFQAGHTYRICVDLRCANNPATAVIDSITAINNAMGGTGAYFSIQASNNNFAYPSNPGSQIISNNYITSGTWQTYSYIFTPAINYTSLWLFPYMSIPSGPAINWGQYEMQVDNIRVEEVANPFMTIFYNGGGTATVTIDSVPPIAGEWHWTPSGVIIPQNADASEVLVDSCGSFQIHAEFVPLNCDICSEYIFDTTINISCCVPPNIEIAGDSVCPGQSLTLGPSSALPGYNYTWSPPGNLSNPNVYNPVFTAVNNGNSPLTYQFTLTADTNGMSCYNEMITVVVFPDPHVDLGPDTTVCTGSAYLLDAENPGASYLWNDGSTYSTLSTDTGGLYSVAVVSAEGCEGADSVSLTDASEPVFGLDTAYICQGDTTALFVNSDAGTSFLWSTGSTDTLVPAYEAGVYWVAVTNECGTVTDSTEVIVTPDLSGVPLPDAFSPNGDGINDEYFIQQLESALSFRMDIYNRWGRNVFTSTDIGTKWTGDGDGSAFVPGGTYFVVVDFVSCSGEEKVVNGIISVYP